MTSKLSQDLAVVATIDPQTLDGTSASSDQVAMTDGNMAMFIVGVGSTDTTVDAKVREAKDSGGTGEQDLSGKAITTLAAGDDNKQAVIEVSSDELSTDYTHLSLDITAGDGTNGADVFAVCLRGHARYQPASNDDLASVAEIVA